MDNQPLTITHQKFTVADAMHLNRHERRRLGKINGFKIPGINTQALRFAKPKIRNPFTKFMRKDGDKNGVVDKPAM